MSISPAKAADALMQALAAAGCTGNFITDIFNVLLYLQPWFFSEYFAADDENLDTDFPHEIVHEEVFDTGGDHFQGGDFVQHW